MKMENVNNNDFTAYLEGLSSYDGRLTLKDNLDLYYKYMVQEIKEMDLSNVDIIVLMQQYKNVMLGENIFDATINWGIINTLYFVIKEKIESEIIKRCTNKEYCDGVPIEDAPYNFEDYHELTYGLPRGVICTKNDGQTIEHKTALFHATAINMCVQFLLKDYKYTSDRINHKIAGTDASNVGVSSIITEGNIVTIYLPYEITKEQMSCLIKDCLNRDNYKFRVVHNGLVYGIYEELNYLDAINFSGSYLCKKEEERKLNLI